MTFETQAAEKKQSFLKRKSTHVGSAILALGLAVAGTATYSNFTDQASLGFSGSAGVLDIQASSDGTTYFDEAPTGGEGEGDYIAIGVGDEFNGILPGQTRTATGYIKNTGTVDAYVDESDIRELSGDLYTGATALTPSLSGIAVDDVIAPGDVVIVTVTVTAPEDWDPPVQENPDGSKSGAYGNGELYVHVTDRPAA
ncbi:hypothetical protein [Paramicrobacterium fandaimingii]|uniref:hypothetical protein n=1 Tax=Paramicrobacterium fandaimingii TaxID=2708079 RepID=UPI0014216608|nr:hypothetical protein [Microbacterium fandaimingii]